MESPLNPEQFSPPSPPDKGRESSPEQKTLILGFTIFLLSESMIFVSLFMSYIILRLTTPNWLPPGLEPLAVLHPAILTGVLVISSLLLFAAERTLRGRKLGGFRILWLTAFVMGVYFLVDQVSAWNQQPFGLTTGLFGGTYYLLTSFHSLHVLVGLFLLMLMLVRSFIPGNYNRGDAGVRVTALFWHFVVVISIILFLLLYFWRA